MILPVLDEAILDEVSHGSYAFPHDVLGVHKIEGGFVIRALRPLAKSVTALLSDGQTLDLEHHYRGIWQAAVLIKSINSPHRINGLRMRMLLQSPSRNVQLMRACVA